MTETISIIFVFPAFFVVAASFFGLVALCHASQEEEAQKRHRIAEAALARANR